MFPNSIIDKINHLLNNVYVITYIYFYKSFS